MNRFSVGKIDLNSVCFCSMSLEDRKYEFVSFFKLKCFSTFSNTVTGFKCAVVPLMTVLLFL